MTIFGSSYRPLSHVPTGPWRRLQPIVQLERGTMLRSKLGWLVFSLCFIPSLISFVAVLMRTGVLTFFDEDMVRELAHVPPEWDHACAEFYLTHSVAGLVVMLILTILVTSRAIAKDRASNALEFYWTRGITPAGYFFAKWFGNFQLLACVFVLGPLGVWLIAVALEVDWTYARDTWWMMLRVAAGEALFATTMAALCLLVSLLAGSPNLATMLWCMLLVGTYITEIVLDVNLRAGDEVLYTSVWDAAANLARAVAGVPTEGSLAGSLVLLGGTIGVLSVLAARRLRTVEAIS